MMSNLDQLRRWPARRARWHLTASALTFLAAAMLVAGPLADVDVAMRIAIEIGGLAYFASAAGVAGFRLWGWLGFAASALVMKVPEARIPVFVVLAYFLTRLGRQESPAVGPTP
jgi:hypothetical protein